MGDFFRYWSIYFRHHAKNKAAVADFILWSIIVLLLAANLVLNFIGTAHAADFDTNVRAVMNEASNQGPRGMVAHAWLFRNRQAAGMELGSSGLNSKKVRARLSREKLHVWWRARRAVQAVFGNEIVDPTNGALWCENVKNFGVPKYIKRGIRAGAVEKCAEIGDVVFWRPVKKNIKSRLK